jgi:transposase InsO family protein
MHKTLKAGALRPPKASAVAQQRAFNTFRREYNEERPHEFLAGATPATATNPLRETVRRGTRPSSIRRTSSSSA